MRIGLIGTGRIGSFHAGVLARHPEVDALVVADTDRARAAKVADSVGATAADSAAEVFGAGVDAVVIASATSAHAELIGQAARAGLPAFCEKPIALDLPGTLSALRAVERARSILQLGFMRRFDAGYGAARAAVRAGSLGRLHTVRAMTMDPAPPPAAYLPLSGGLYRDCLVHDFDMLRWVTGREVTEVYATGSDAGPEMFRAAGDVDTAAALLTLDDGTLVTATATRCNGAGYDVRMELAGELGQITVGLDDRTPVTSAEPRGPAAPHSPWPGFLERFGAAYEAELDAFVRVVRGALPNPCDGREAWYALLIAEACEVSRRERRPVEIAEIAEIAGGTAARPAETARPSS
ncbi:MULTISPECIES: Gfo/Idh/MocA family protein [unclassified Streptomyces]|uniref:Gfo/Idh/MocA family protein n=1 Tax=unclassified Streptomyces TaxID=2593676 RepID=UPI002257F859|nr:MULTISPECIES: Gfo/Idh/MocA family oxidoreductase [unclassified Streptomyces]WSP58501.1 Gfo/Idh/MocA family oxidoreductase [Streptomyces sp. NBC_01241]WSU20924.1 Gfo/Idh/MocA family oxidoreductase [Streptomyces sp. NBC_01108]MCX4790266.1 Gfo/Idh/MocA family oxidoreductase [Streptomyces sp. NBC_01221]MCX4794006.1 Gfo/Idh/MocA family oxidoreductase [Streptomyces sp. NBC_01242]WSJ35416.1 Gfo/Idh/MocA family oxidoreductase [Streptomyces sp. NBC_01321]